MGLCIYNSIFNKSDQQIHYLGKILNGLHYLNTLKYFGSQGPLLMDHVNCRQELT